MSGTRDWETKVNQKTRALSHQRSDLHSIPIATGPASNRQTVGEISIQLSSVPSKHKMPIFS